MPRVSSVDRKACAPNAPSATARKQSAAAIRIIVMSRFPKHESDFWCGDDMVRAWVASPLLRGRVRIASRQSTRLLDKARPSPSSSPLLRGERRQDHPRELILILIDLQMMSLGLGRDISGRPLIRLNQVISSESDASPTAFLDHSRLLVGFGELFSHRKLFQPLQGLLPRENSAPVRVSRDTRQELRQC
jgi:hypothetical protein